MRYRRDFFEYTCTEGHANKIDKSYLANDLDPNPVIRFTDRLPCSGCDFKLVPASLVRTLRCDLSEIDFYKIQEEKYVESVAYHEAAHIAAAAVQQMPLGKKGIRIDQKGSGISFYKFFRPDGSRDAGATLEREQTIKSIQAAYIAQEKFYLRFYDRLPESGAHIDTDNINALLREMYTNRNEFDASKSKLFDQATQIVENNWQAIESLAQTLWAKKWTSQAPPSGERRWSTQMREKWMSGVEIIGLLQRFRIPAVLDDSAEGHLMNARAQSGQRYAPTQGTRRDIKRT